MPILSKGGPRAALCVASLIAVGAIAPEAEARTEADARCKTDFLEITAGAPACGFTLSDTGKFSKGDRTLADPLVASYEGGATGEKPIAAEQLVLFPPSPSGRFRIVQACDGSGTSALCWSVFVLDEETGQLHETYAGHYGPERWQSWSPDQKHVVLADSAEGAWWLHVIEPTSGDGKDFPSLEAQENWVIQPETLHWTGPRGFTVTVESCESCQPAPKEISF